jgi:hypothetical protein
LRLPAGSIFYAEVCQRRGIPKILDSVTLAFFACMVLGIVVFRWMALATYMSLLVNLTLMTIA